MAKIVTVTQYEANDGSLFLSEAECNAHDFKLENGAKIEAVNEMEWINGKIWANIYQNPDSMIDVGGRDPQAEQQAPIQKANLVNAFENMKVQIGNLKELGN